MFKVIYLVLLIAVLAVGSVSFVFCQDWGEEQDLQPRRPTELDQEKLNEWYKEQDKIQKALDEISDPNKYEKNKYECNKFSDYTANELAKKGFNVKRAMTDNFKGTGQHHWVFVIATVCGKEMWVPIECTPPEDQTQKDPGRLDQWPRIPEEKDKDGRPTGNFDEDYFKKVKTRNFTVSDSTDDLKYIHTGEPVLKMYFGYLDVVEACLTRTRDQLEINIVINEGIPPLNLTTFFTVLIDANNEPEDNSQSYPYNDVDTMYSVIYDSTANEWKIERASYESWGWDVKPTAATWGMTSSWPDGQVTIQIGVPLTELPVTLPKTLPWKVITETFNGASIGDFAPEQGLSYAYLHPDIIPPLVTIISPTNQTYTTLSIGLSIVANEPIDNFVYSLNQGENVTFSGNVTVEASYGLNELVVYARDLEENVGFSLVAFRVKFLGDLDGNGKVDIIDIATVARAFGCKPGDERWNDNTDLDKNGWINIIDITLVAKDYGKTV